MAITGVPSGEYAMKVYHAGYKVNDPYDTYLELGKPQQLTERQVEYIKKLNNGSPVLKEIIKITGGLKYDRL